MIYTNKVVIKYKIALLNLLAEELGNTLKACKIMDVSCDDTFCRYQKLVGSGGIVNLTNKSRRRATQESSG